MPGANPSGAVAPPPLAGEAFLVVRTRARSFYGHARRHVMPGANPQGPQPPLQGEVPPTGGGGVNRVSELGRCMCCHNMARFTNLVIFLNHQA